MQSLKAQPGPVEPLSMLKLKLKQHLGDFVLDVDLAMASSGVTALFGPSGSGKTTLLRLIAGLEQGFGEITFKGTLWVNANTQEPTHRRAVGYVFQEASLMPHLNVRQNLSFAYNTAASAKRMKVELNNNNAGFFDEIVAFLGLRSLLDHSPGGLSGGQRQRAAIACALLSRPQLLLMDEPLASLDAQSKAQILPYIERLHKVLDIPVIYVSHALSEVAQLADNLVLMDAGRVLAHGPTNEVLTDIKLPLACLGEALAVLRARVTRIDSSDHLTSVTTPAGELLLTRTDIPLDEWVRVGIAAKDVSIALAPAANSSISSVLAATVIDITPTTNPAQMLVRLNASGETLLARVTLRSTRQLGLKAGLDVYAQIKSVSLMR